MHFHIAVWVGLLRMGVSTKVIWQRPLYLFATSFLWPFNNTWFLVWSTWRMLCIFCHCLPH